MQVTVAMVFRKVRKLRAALYPVSSDNDTENQPWLESHSDLQAPSEGVL